MHYRLLKFLHGTAYLAAVVVTVLWFRGLTDWRLGAGSLTVSAFWLLLTAIDLRHLFRTYFDILSRLSVLVPLALGLALSVLGFFTVPEGASQLVAVGLVCGWLLVYLRYRHNRLSFQQEGHGPLPEGSWINPPAEALEPGDLILTGGMVADTLHESVGHSETVVLAPDGSHVLFSSYMDRGLVFDPISTLAAEEIYVVVRQTVPFTPVKLALEYPLASIMIGQSAGWAEKAKAARDERLRKFAWILPQSFSTWLNRKFPITGYDWVGMFSGRIAPDHWICITSNLELFHRLGVATKQYGVGLLGFGTGLFDPTQPVRVLNDPAFRLLTLADKAAFESKREKARIEGVKS
ncbi:MAG: hypothetical protein P4L53_08770 [Candidatus Obscuribacterales bacterium]|nr:hypothetical protein [Candidatus Obscuribacterales bacterium]